MELAEKIKTLRKQKGISQKELADLVGVAQASINKLEKGNTINPNVNIALKIAEVLETDIYELFSDTPHKPTSITNEETVIQVIESQKTRLVYAVENFFNSLSAPIMLQLRVESDPAKIKALEKELKGINDLHQSLYFHLTVNNILTHEDRNTYYKKIESLKKQHNEK